MKKKLKIKFWKAEKALAMQILEQEGLPKAKSDGFVNIVTISAIYKDTIYLRGDCHKGDFNIDGVLFETNSERDKYLDKITNAITDELFIGKGDLKVGEMCEVALCNGDWGQRKLLAILPDNYSDRYIVDCTNTQSAFYAYSQARPIIKRTDPKVETNCEIVTYTWEEE